MKNTLISEKQLVRIIQKKTVLSEFEKSGLSLSAFCRIKGLSISTLWRDLYRSKKGNDHLMDHRGLKKKPKVHIEDNVAAWVFSYLSIHPKTKTRALYRILLDVGEKNSWVVPSYSSICRFLRSAPKDLRTLLVENSRVHFERWGIVLKKNENNPNACWQIDASEFPVWVLDPATGEIFKPWITALIDCATRVVMGYRLHREFPDTGEVLLALRNAILPKDSETYPFFGIPQKIQSDNGTIFKSADFMDSLMRLEIEQQLINPHCPSANGKIERWFQTCQDQLARNLNGYADQYRGLAKAQKYAIPWPLLPQYFEKYLLEYHLAHHSELGMSPWEAWHQKLMSAHGLSFNPQTVIDALKIRKEVLVQRDGVTMESGRQYHSSKLAGVVGEKVIVRYSPDGIPQKLECYFKGEFLDDLESVEAQGTLATDIKQARLDRVIELQRLRKTLIETAKKIQSDESPTPSVSPEEAIETLPKLKTEEEQ